MHVCFLWRRYGHPAPRLKEVMAALDFEQRINGKVVLKTIEPVRARLQDLSAVFFARTT